MRTLILSLCAVALALPARATVLIPADLGELAHDALAIARGRVAAVDAQWTEDRGTIETIVTLEVEGYLKGALGIHGAVPNSRRRARTLPQHRRRAPEFAVGQRIIVFLGARGPSVPHVLGLSQGVFRIARAADDSGWS